LDAPSADADPARYECPDRAAGRDLAGDFADWINDHSAHDVLSIATLEAQVQMVPNTDEDQALIEENRPQFDALARGRGCSPF
jgi:hypothetical protein